MDVYSRRIVGYTVADNMRAENNLKALKIALKLRGVHNYSNRLIHHSDRGSQYISEAYVGLLKSKGIQISMCMDVLENAHIERLNGTIKNQYLKHGNIQTYKELVKQLDRSVLAYNNRPHQSLNYKTPIEFEDDVKKLSLDSRYKLELFCTKQINDKKNPNQLILDF